MQLHKSETAYIASESVRENVETQVFLTDLHLSAFEIPNKKRLFWLNKAVSQESKPQLKEYAYFL